MEWNGTRGPDAGAEELGASGPAISRSRMELANINSQFISHCPFCGLASLEEVSRRQWRCTSCSRTLSLASPNPEDAIDPELPVRRLHNVFTSAPVGMAVHEAHPPYRIKSHNPAYLTIWPEESRAKGIVGRSLLDCLPQEACRLVAEQFEEVIRTRRPKTLHEFCHVCPPADPTWWNWSLVPLFEAGDLAAVVHLAVDVTHSVRSREELSRLVEKHTAQLETAKEHLEKQVARRKNAQTILRRHMERHRKIIDNIPVMLTLFTPEGGIQLLNREFRRLTGWSEREVRRMKDPMAAFFPDLQVRRQIREFFLRSPSDWKEFPIMTQKGERLDSLWTSVRLSDGSQIGIGLDLRQRLEADRRLEALNRDLNRRAEQLHFLAMEVTEAEDRERRHLADLLHDDLQQMLVAAKYQLNFIREGVGQNESLREDICELQKILNESIAMTRGLSHELSPSALHQESLAHALLILARQMKEKYGLEVRVEARDDYTSPLDNIKSFLYKAVQEMFLNIIKHAGTHRAAVTLWQEGFEFNVSVADEGKGFDPAEMERRKGSPAGMGLFKIQERVRLMGGRCQVRSAPGEGTCVTLSLPLRPVPKRTRKFQIVERAETDKPVSETPSVEGAESRLRILLADDHDVVRKGIAALLCREPDVEIVGQASNGRQAVELAKQLRPDLILMDMTMPEMDGLEATRILQRENPEIKIIALSMHDKRDMAEHMIKAGAMLYLNKSDAFEELLGAIRKLMGIAPAAIH